jgi:hypothetical protein
MKKRERKVNGGCGAHTRVKWFSLMNFNSGLMKNEMECQKEGKSIHCRDVAVDDDHSEEVHDWHGGDRG